MESLDKRYQKELTFDLPIEYKGLLLHPVKMIDYFDFIYACCVFQQDKNAKGFQYISKTYLEFLVDIIKQGELEGQMYGIMLYKIFSLVLDETAVEVKYGTTEDNKPYLEVKDTTLDSAEFEEIRDLILLQNLPKYKHEEILDKDLQKDIKEYQRLTSKGTHMASLEKQILAIQLGYGLSSDYIYNMSIRKFQLAFEIMEKKTNYLILKQASMSGFVTFKNEINHYLMENDVEEQTEGTVEAQSFINKIQSAH